MQTGVPLNFAAAGFGNAAVANQINRVGRQFMLGRDRPPDRLDVAVPILVPQPHGFGDDDQLFPPVVLHRHRPDAAGLHHVAGLFDRFLDVLRVTVHAADDDHVF